MGGEKILRELPEIALAYQALDYRELKGERFAEALMQVVAIDVEAQASLDSILGDGTGEPKLNVVTSFLRKQRSDKPALQLMQRGQVSSP